MEVLFDGQPVADLKTAERVVLHLPPGDHLLGVRPVCPIGGTHGLSEVAARIAPDVPLSFRIGVTAEGGAFINPTKY